MFSKTLDRIDHDITFDDVTDQKLITVTNM